MKYVARTSLLSLAALAGSLLATTDAPAQPQNGSGGGMRLQRPVPALTTGVSNATIERVKRGGDVASNGALDGVPVLNGFRFRFTSGDHELRQVGVVASTPSSARLTFFDRNADDPFNASASWVVVRGGGTRGSVIAVGAGQYDIPLPTQRPGDMRLVLTGFELTRNDDHNVRLIGVWLDEARNVARVSFLDDQGNFESSFSSRLGQAGTPFNPAMGRAGAVVANANEANARLAKLAAMGGPVAFTAKIHYAFIPNAVVTGEDYFTGTTRTPASGKTFPERAGLQGFEFFFDNKDHHILDLGVMPPLAGGIVRTWPSLPARPDEAIAFQDSNRNDPIKWAVKFVTLR